MVFKSTVTILGFAKKEERQFFFTKHRKQVYKAKTERLIRRKPVGAKTGFKKQFNRPFKFFFLYKKYMYIFSSETECAISV